MYDMKRCGPYPAPLLSNGVPSYPAMRLFGGPRQLGTLTFPTLSGIVAVYDNLFWHHNHWHRFRPSAFDEVLKSRPTVPIMIRHQPKFTIPGTIVFLDGDCELSCQIQLDDTAIGRDLVGALRFGRFVWLSVGYSGRMSPSRIHGIIVQNIDTVTELSEISFVDQSAQLLTSVDIVSEPRFGQPTALPSIARDRTWLRHFVHSVGYAGKQYVRTPVFPTASRKTKRPAERNPAVASKWVAAATTTKLVPAKSKRQRVPVVGAMRK